MRKIHFEPDSVQQRPVAMGKKSFVVTSISSVTGISAQKSERGFSKTTNSGTSQDAGDLQITTDPYRSHKMSKIAQIKFRDPYSEALMRC